MGREGAEACFHVLLVADVGKHAVKDGNRAAGLHRYVHARLRHQHEKPDGFHGNGFAACIGAGDDEGGGFRAFHAVDGNHGAAVKHPGAGWRLRFAVSRQPGRGLPQSATAVWDACRREGR